MASWTYPQSGRRWSGGTGAALSIGIHVIVVAMLLAARTPLPSQPTPISVHVLSELARQENKPLQIQHRPQIDVPALHIPQPDLVLADNQPATAAPVAVSSVAMTAEPTPSAPSVPRFDADYLNNPAPSYPPLSRRMREEGIVLVRIFVTSEGLPDQIELKRSSGSVRLDEAALSVVRKWRFVPAKRGSEAVAAWVVVPIAFSLTA